MTRSGPRGYQGGVDEGRRGKGKRQPNTMCGEHQGHAKHARFLIRPPAESGNDVTIALPIASPCLNQRRGAEYVQSM
jgi:hypothetical protein